ncbi:MAG: pyruvate dehydrogenase (acetyl-transferring) E1 component subunit alpha, partial [Alphaproteobacteria bacterium]
ITQVKDMLQAEGVPEEDIKAIDKDIKAIVTEAAEFSQQSPEPHPDELWTDVLVEV